MEEEDEQTLTIFAVKEQSKIILLFHFSETPKNPSKLTDHRNFRSYFAIFGYVIIVYIPTFNMNVVFAYLIFLWLGNVLSGFKNDIKDKECQEKACKVAKCQEHNKALCHAHDWNRHLCH